ncbi:hypothetical protein B0J14DRAFT_650772 [Halenospora varia]|nr:hypothetical protein B0J14DRAFT_650772 [Halenospora varia]
MDSSNDRGLSPGAIAGIVIGVLLVILVGLEMTFVRRTRRRRQQQQSSTTSPEGLEVSGEKYEVEANSKDVKSLGAELPDTRRSKLWAMERRVELSGSEGPQQAKLHSDIAATGSDFETRGEYAPIQDLTTPAKV